MRRVTVPTVVACAFGAWLEGCASSAVPPEAPVQQARLRSWQKLCEDRGFTRGTPDFDVCVMGYDREAVKPPR